MSEILKVLNKKVELKSEVVELGLIDDLTSKYKTALSNYNKAKNNYLKASSSFDSALFSLEGDVGEDYIEKIKRASKELGVDLPKEVKSIETNIKSIVSEHKSKYLK